MFFASNHVFFSHHPGLFACLCLSRVFPPKTPQFSVDSYLFFDKKYAKIRHVSSYSHTFSPAFFFVSDTPPLKLIDTTYRDRWSARLFPYSNSLFYSQTLETLEPIPSRVRLWVRTSLPAFIFLLPASAQLFPSQKMGTSGRQTFLPRYHPQPTVRFKVIHDFFGPLTFPAEKLFTCLPFQIQRSGLQDPTFHISTIFFTSSSKNMDNATLNH